MEREEAFAPLRGESTSKLDSTSAVSVDGTKTPSSSQTRIKEAEYLKHFRKDSTRYGTTFWASCILLSILLAYSYRSYASTDTCTPWMPQEDSRTHGDNRMIYTRDLKIFQSCDTDCNGVLGMIEVYTCPVKEIFRQHDQYSFTWPEFQYAMKLYNSRNAFYALKLDLLNEETCWNKRFENYYRQVIFEASKGKASEREVSKCYACGTSSEDCTTLELASECTNKLLKKLEKKYMTKMPLVPCQD